MSNSDLMWEDLLKASKALVACAEKIYAGSYRVSTDAIEKLQEQIDKVEEQKGVQQLLGKS